MAAATVIGPIRERQINDVFYVTSNTGGGFDTIQAAIDYVRVYNAGLGQIIICHGHFNESISTLTGGTVATYITDLRDALAQNWRWSGTNFLPFNDLQLVGFLAKGTPQAYPAANAIGSTTLGFSPTGAGGNGRGDLIVTATTGRPMPAVQLSGQPADGTPFHSFFRADTDPTGKLRVQMPQALDLANMDGNINLWTGQTRALTGSKGMTVQAKPTENAIDFQGQTIGGANDQTIRLNPAGGGVEIADLTVDHADFNTANVGNSPVRTFANTPDGGGPGGMIWPTFGVPISEGDHWADPSIDPATLPRTNTANTFTQNQSIQGQLTANAISSGAGGITTTGGCTADGGFFTVGGVSAGSSGITTTGSCTATGGFFTLGAVSSTTVTATGNVSAGSVTAVNSVSAGTGGISTTGGCTADGGFFTVGGVSAGTSGITTTGSCTATGGFFTAGSVQAGSITASSTITATGTVTAGSVSAGSSGISTTGACTATGGFFTAGSVQAGNITASTTITATGNIQAGSVSTGTGGITTTGSSTATGGFFTGATVQAGNITASTTITATGTVTAGTVSAGTGGISTTGSSTAAGFFTLGTVQAGNITASTTITATGNIQAGSVSTGNSGITTSGACTATGGFFTGAGVSSATITATGACTATGGFFTGAGISSGTGGISTTGGCTATVGFFTSGTKAFRITHPLDDTKTLTHASLEGPEIGVYYRGEAVTADGSVELTLPDYFEALVQPEGRTVLLTQLFEEDTEDFAQLAASRVVGGKFRVRSSVPVQKFYWEVKAVRADLPSLVVVAEKVGE